MQLFPSPEAEQTRSCAGCGQLVARADCHRNRYSEYICTSCQASGLRFTWPNRLRNYLRRSALVMAIVAVAGTVGMLVLWLFYALFLKLDVTRILFG